MMKQYFMWITITVLVVCCISGCGVWKKHHKLYDGPSLPQDKIAFLNGSYPIYLYEVDSIPGPNWMCNGCPPIYNAGFDGEFSIEILPGLHSLTATYMRYEYTGAYGRRRMTTQYSDSIVILSFFSKAGHTYICWAAEDGNSVSFLVEDESSGEDVTAYGYKVPLHDLPPCIP